MESSRDDAAAQLAAAEQLRGALAADLRLPAGFHLILGSAAAVMIGAAALSAGSSDSRTAAAAGITGTVVFLAVAAYLVRRFRAVNGASVSGLLTNAVFGSTTEASLAFGVPFAFATWAALAGLPWLTLLLAVVGGVAYAAAARRWWAAYQRDPAAHAESQSRTALLALVCLVVAAGVLVYVGVFVS